jgi:hypothetical protein
MKSNNIQLKNLINNNLKKNNIHEQSEIAYASRFFHNLIKEQDELPKSDDDANVKDLPSAEDQQKAPEEFTPDINKKDFENSLDKDTPSDKFDVEGVSAEKAAEVIASIREWSSKLDDFAEFLNDPSQTTSEGRPSLHKILSDGDRSGSLLRGITRKASDSITRIAGEVEKLKEILNTYIITAPKKLRDTEGQVAGWTQF